jgi:hypothetical protein
MYSASTLLSLPEYLTRQQATRPASISRGQRQRIRRQLQALSVPVYLVAGVIRRIAAGAALNIPPGAMYLAEFSNPMPEFAALEPDMDIPPPPRILAEPASSTRPESFASVLRGPPDQEHARHV